MIDTQPTKYRDLETDHTLIRAELDRLLVDRRFAGAPQMSAFLRYIVNETLDGNASRIKAFSVGVDALGKPDNFDAQTDPSVRVLALRLRKTLDATYEDPSAALVIVKLKVGTYVPTFFMVNNSVDQKRSDSHYAHKTNVVAHISPRPTPEAHAERVGEVGSARMERSTQSLDGSSTPETSPQQKSFSGVLRHSDNLANKKWLVGAGVALFFMAWQIAVKNSDVQASAHTEAPMLMSTTGNASELVQADGVLTRTAINAPEQPTIVVSEVNNVQEFERKITLLLTSSILETGTVGVVQISNGLASGASRPGEYQLLVSSYHVGDKVRVNTQIVSLWDGQMLLTETVVLDPARHILSDEDLNTIETLATGLISTQGPLFEDYCARYDTEDGGLVGCSAT